ncbi:MAG: NAD(P)/FAD-dependent oxidoreductase [Nocardioides sp.]
MNEYDVVVVGARVAGASTALLLARAGVRVALLDRGRYGSDTLSTHALMRAGVMQLSRWGLLDAVAASGAVPVRKTLFHYGGEETVEVSIRPGAGVDALYAPRRHVLDRIIVDAAAEAGVDVMHATTVTGLLRDGDSRVRGVRTRTGSGDRDLRAAMVIGADGLRSVVADQAGATVERRGRNVTSVLYRYFTDLPAAGYEWAYGDHAAAGVIPTHDGACCVFVGCTPDRMHALRSVGTDDAFSAVLRDAAPGLVDRVAAAQPVTRMHGWAGATGHVLRSWGAGWALVGDAGYFKDPCTAHGITDALRDAELLSDEVVEVLAGGASEKVALARYQSTRDRLSRGLFDATEAVASYSWDLEEVRGLLRRVNSSMSDEVDHLQGLPDRAVRPGLSPDVPPDSVGLPR